MLSLKTYMEFDRIYEETILKFALGEQTEAKVFSYHDAVIWDEEGAGQVFVVLPGYRAQRLDGTGREIIRLGSTREAAFQAYRDLHHTNEAVDTFKLAIGRDRYDGSLVLGVFDREITFVP